MPRRGPKRFRRTLPTAAKTPGAQECVRRPLPTTLKKPEVSQPQVTPYPTLALPNAAMKSVAVSQAQMPPDPTCALPTADAKNVGFSQPQVKPYLTHTLPTAAQTTAAKKPVAVSRPLVKAIHPSGLDVLALVSIVHTSAPSPPPIVTSVPRKRKPSRTSQTRTSKTRTVPVDLPKETPEQRRLLNQQFLESLKKKRIEEQKKIEEMKRLEEQKKIEEKKRSETNSHTPSFTTTPPNTTKTPPSFTTTTPSITKTPPNITKTPPSFTTTTTPSITKTPPNITKSPPSFTTTTPSITKTPPNITKSPPSFTKSPQIRTTVRRHGGGQQSDPKMTRAIQARLLDPTLSLQHALEIGGFVFDRLDKDTYDMIDAKNITLTQRKNQLSRRLRKLKRAGLVPQQELPRRNQGTLPGNAASESR